MLELAIAILLAGVVISAVFSLYLTQHQQMLRQGEVSDMQANIRSAAGALVNFVQMAGFNVPKCVDPIETRDTNPDTIVITFDSSQLKDVVIKDDMLDLVSPIHCQGSDLGNISAGDWIYLYDPTNSIGEFCHVSSVNDPHNLLYHDTPVTREYLQGTQVMKLRRLKVYVDHSDSVQKNLMIQEMDSSPQVYAEGISNLNFRYILADGSVVSQTTFPRFIHMVEIDISAATAAPGFFNSSHRTRNLSLRTKVRNLGMP
jgi:hypothetical protein